MKHTPNNSYLTIYIPKDTVDSFRSHCASHGYVMSKTIAILIEEYLRKEKGDG
jgi:hypothetical protein